MRPTPAEEIQLRRTGHRGGVILPHRAMLTLRPRWTALVGSALTAVMLSLAWWIVLPQVVRGWQRIATLALEVLGLDAPVRILTLTSSWGFSIDVPLIEASAGEPTSTQWWWGTILCVILLALSFLLRRRHLPLIYFFRLLVMLQASSQFVFYVFPGSFPHSIAGLTQVLFAASFFLVMLVPWLYGLTFFVLDFSLTKKIAVTLLTMGHLFLFIPLQYAAHAYLIHHGSLLVMPMMFWMFGLAVDVAIVIGFYGWAVSWKPLPYLQSRFGEKVATAGVALLLCALLASPAAAERNHSVEIGIEESDYDQDLGKGESQFIAYSTSRYRQDRWRFDFGHAKRFGDEGVGFGASYEREVAPRWALNGGLSTGTGDVIFPDLRWDLGVRHDGLLGTPAILRASYTHIESKSENRSDGGEIGLFVPVGRGWDLWLGERVELGQPGDTVSHTFLSGIRWGRWRRWYLGAGFRTGETSYVLFAPDDPRVDFSSRSWDLSATWYVVEGRGLSVRYEQFESDVYDFWSIGVRTFVEW